MKLPAEDQLTDQMAAETEDNIDNNASMPRQRQ
jgi:hypothetical protein